MIALSGIGTARDSCDQTKGQSALTVYGQPEGAPGDQGAGTRNRAETGQ